MALYKTVRRQKTLSGVKNYYYEQVKMKPAEVKKYIMRANNWTSEQYNKQYDIFKNKLRAYENYTGKSKGERQSPVEVLYKEARAKVREGADYEPSLEMRRIRSFTSISSGQAGQKALQSERYTSRRGMTYSSFTSARFKGLIDANEKAREIAESIEDPVKREKALADYANKLHDVVGYKTKNANGEAIPSGEVAGSDLEIDFDIEAYL